ncbi:MAG TPA: hypothetical protein PLS12_10670, partial [Bacteroidales bacterium]|nr:hypothetical protein [Bacteroidales bacterium]
MYDSACHNSYKWQQTNLRMAVNPDQYGNGFNDYSLQSEAASWGKDFTFTINGTLAAADNSINFEIRTGYNFTTCSAIGIADILITGCLNPQIKSSKDKEVCTGEQTLLTLDKEYYANSYTWQKSTNGGSTWTTISTAKSVIDAVTQNSVYRVNVDGTLSSNFAITTITCCIVNGQPSSREVVFHDDFGRFPSSNSYIDAFGNVTNGLTAPFRAPVPYTIPNHQYSTSGPVDDGWYAVSSYMYKNVATWLGAIPEDHSKEPDGGYLIINVNHNFKGIIYDRLITGLCEGKELYFDAFAGNASDAQPPKLILYIKSPDGLTTLAQSPLTTLNAGGGWVRIQVPTFVLSGYTSVRIVIDSQGEGWTSGNDLVLDDIKIMACAPPMLELFSDLPTLTKNKEVCSTTLELGFTPSNLLLNFYGNNPRYLFQWSKTPTVASSWTNLGTPQTVSTYSIPDPKNSTPFAGVPNGGKVYFRVIAATPAVFTSKTNFTAPNY